MFVPKETIQELSEQFGHPKEVSFSYEISVEEFERIKSSQKNGREHDVTIYIRKDDKFIVIAKHFYPQGLFRAPSGGINPNEDFIAGAKREVLEETGCEVSIQKFLLQTHVQFKLVNSDKVINWHSYVFLAEYISGDFQFTDTNEIREVTTVTLAEYEKFSATMRSTSIGGLHYRADMHDVVKQLL